MPESADGLPELPAEFWQTLDAGLGEMGLELNERSRAAIDSHVRLLIAWNDSINLTSLRTPEQIARSHVLDSVIAIAPLHAVAGTNLGRVVDLGSGGGFPALPIAAVAPVRRVVLVDSVGKKARFLAVAGAAVSNSLVIADGPRPEIAAAAERAEDLAAEADYRDAADLVLARAVGSVAEVAELGLPLARVRGHVVMWKHDPGDGKLQMEIENARRISQACGGSSPRVIRLEAAARIGLAGHCLVVVQKRRPTPNRYPRPAAERRRAARALLS